VPPYTRISVSVSVVCVVVCVWSRCSVLSTANGVRLLWRVRDYVVVDSSLSVCVCVCRKHRVAPLSLYICLSLMHVTLRDLMCDCPLRPSRTSRGTRGGQNPGASFRLHGEASLALSFSVTGDVACVDAADVWLSGPQRSREAVGQREQHALEVAAGGRLTQGGYTRPHFGST
jgi:hypothetical protein